MDKIMEELSRIGIVPVIKINDAGKAADLAQALKRGGIPCAEVTFRTAEAAKAIKNITDTVEDVIVGAGTVTTVEQVDLALESGAKFIVAPGFNEKIVKYCMEKGVPVFPGVQTPSEIERAMELGLKTLKFFPAEQSGGIAMIKALSGPYGGIRFMPTGGITEANINDYLALDCIAACGGSFMAEPSLVDSGKYDEIERISRKTVDKMLGLTVKEMELKPGEAGRMVIATNHVGRAIYHLERRGIQFNYDTLKTDEKGKAAAISIRSGADGTSIQLLKN